MAEVVVSDSRRPRSRPRKVLMTSDAVGGIWTFSIALARALSRSGVSVMLAVMGPAPAPEDRREAGEIPGLELRWRPYRLEWMEDPWADLQRAGEWLRTLEARERPDLVHLNGFSLADGTWASPVVVSGHSCVLSWWRAVRGEKPPATLDRYRRSVAAGIGAASAVAAPSRAMLRALDELYGLPPVRRVVMNGLDPSAFAPVSKEPIVLGVGRLWDEAKNLSALDRAAAGLPWPVLVAGEASGPDGGAIRLRHARALGRLAPPELRSLYARSAVFAHPARYEPFGLAPLEAALSGCALVLGDIPSLREVWGGAARYVPPDDPRALRRELEAFIADSGRRESFAARARLRAKRYTAAAMAAGYLDLYARARWSFDHRGRRTSCAS